MRKKSKKVLAILLLLVGLHSPATSQGRRWREVRGRPLVEFDWNCASPSAYPKAELGRIVRSSARLENIEAGAEADRAFAFDLNGDRKPEYFVPLVCGAVGNCDWGVFGLNPARFMGVVNGQYIYVHRRAGRWPDIITYGHFSAAEGSLGTYSFRRGRYAPSGEAYPTDVRGGVYGNKVPGFLDRARPACENVGH